MANVVKLTIPHGKRIICISDAHGHFDIFQRLLDNIGFCDDDILILLGDICVGRHNNKNFDEFLEFTVDLCKRENVYAIRGNWDVAGRLPKMIDKDTKARAIAWFESLPHIIETPDYVFIPWSKML